MFILKNFNGKTLRGIVTEKTDFHYTVRWDDGALGILLIEDENKWYKLYPSCRVVSTKKNETIFTGLFEECRRACRERWSTAGHSPDFLVRNGYTEVLFLNGLVAQIVSD